MREPKPYVSAYSVRRLDYTLDEQGKVVPKWATYAPEIINTVDIEETLRQPNTFLIGWQETHFELVSEQIKGTLTERWREVILEHQHDLNLGIAQKISETYGAAMKQNGTVVLPRYQSFEAALFRCGWKFEFEAVGDDAKSGNVIPPEIIPELMKQPEMVLLNAGNLFEVAPAEERPATPVHTPVQAMEPVQLVEIPVKESEDRLDKLELLIGRLAESVINLTGVVNEKLNRVRDSKPRASRAKRKAVSVSIDHTDSGPTTPIEPQYGETVHQHEGVVPLG